MLAMGYCINGSLESAGQIEMYLWTSLMVPERSSRNGFAM